MLKGSGACVGSLGLGLALAHWLLSPGLDGLLSTSVDSRRGAYFRGLLALASWGFVGQ